MNATVEFLECTYLLTYSSSSRPCQKPTPKMDIQPSRRKERIQHKHNLSIQNELVAGNSKGAFLTTHATSRYHPRCTITKASNLRGFQESITTVDGERLMIEMDEKEDVSAGNLTSMLREADSHNMILAKPREEKDAIDYPA